MKNLNQIQTLVPLILLIGGMRVQAQLPTWSWANELAQTPSSADVTGWAVAADGQGNVYATGSISGDTIDINGNTFYNPGYAWYIVKYDSAGTMLWARVDGGDGLNTPGGIATDSGGNLIVGGSFSGDSVVFGGTTLYNSNTPKQDVLVVKYDTNGNLLWVVSAGSSDNEWIEAVATDSQGNIFIAGSFNGASLTLGGTTVMNTFPGTEDIYIAKLNDAGTFLWARSAGGGNYEWATSVSADPFGNTVICGPYFSDTCSFGSAQLVSPYGNNHDQLFVAQYDSSGNVNWARQVVLTAQAYDSYFYDVVADVFGNVYATGSCISDTVYVDTLQLPASPNSYRDMILVKYSPNGQVQWARRETGTGNIHAFDLAANESGEVYVTGYFNCDSIVFGTDTALAIDPWFWSDTYVAKYTPSGNVEWALQVGGTYVPGTWGYRQMGIAADPLGHVFVSGTYINDSVVFGGSTLNLDNCFPNVYIAMLDDADACSASFSLMEDTTQLHHYWAVNQATGVPPLAYSWDWGDGSVDTGAYPSHVYATQGYYTICLTVTDALACTHTECHTNYLQRSSGETGAGAMVTVNVVPSIPTFVSTPSFPGFGIHPNPATISLTIDHPGIVEGTAYVFDAFGRLVVDVRLAPERTVLPVDNLAQGVYAVWIRSAGGVYATKLVIRR